MGLRGAGGKATGCLWGFKFKVRVEARGMLGWLEGTNC